MLARIKDRAKRWNIENVFFACLMAVAGLILVTTIKWRSNQRIYPGEAMVLFGAGVWYSWMVVKTVVTPILNGHRPMVTGTRFQLISIILMIVFSVFLITLATKSGFSGGAVRPLPTR